MYLRYGDGELEDNSEFRGHIVHAIRKYRPDVVLATDPHRRSFYLHRDHRMVGLGDDGRGVPLRPATACTTRNTSARGWRLTKSPTFSTGELRTRTRSLTSRTLSR